MPRPASGSDEVLRYLCPRGDNVSANGRAATPSVDLLFCHWTMVWVWPTRRGLLAYHQAGFVNCAVVSYMGQVDARIHLRGAVDVCTGELDSLILTHVNTACMQLFLDEVSLCHPDRRQASSCLDLPQAASSGTSAPFPGW